MRTVAQAGARFGKRAGLLAGAAAFATGAFAKKYAEYADSIAKTADRIGLGIEELQKLRHAFDIGGVSVAKTDKALGFFTKAVGEAATGTGEAKPIFEAMGVAIHDQEGNIRPMGELLDDVADAMAAQEDPAKKAFAATRLFGRAGIEMVNTLDDGSVKMRATGDEMIKPRPGDRG